MKGVSAAVLIALYSSAAMATMTMPAPPPDLPTTLKEYRTQEQINEKRVVTNDKDVTPQEPVDVPSAPFVPGDDSAGVVRTSGLYVPGQIIAIPADGAGIIRFYDLQGIPWDIADTRIENQGFNAEVTALASELLITQQQGAATSTLAVYLDNYPDPLIFTLRSVRMENNGIKVNTVLNAVKAKGYRTNEFYYFPEIHQIPKTNPAAESYRFEDVDQSKIERLLINAVRELKDEQNNAD